MSKTKVSTPKKRIRIFGLDLGNHCGYAFYENHKPKDWGLNDLGKYSLGERYCRFRDMLPALLPSGLSAVAVEQAGFVARAGGMMNARNFFAMDALVRMWCFEYHVPYFSYAPGTVKKTLTGNGRAKKPEMIKAAKLLLPKRQELSEHEADAIGVALTCLKQEFNSKE